MRSVPYESHPLFCTAHSISLGYSPMSTIIDSFTSCDCVAHEKRFRWSRQRRSYCCFKRFTSKLLDGDNVPSIRKVYIKVNYVSFCGRVAANPFALCSSRYEGIWSGKIMECFPSHWGFGRRFNGTQECSVLIYVCVILGIFLTYLWNVYGKREKPVKQLRFSIFH